MKKNNKFILIKNLKDYRELFGYTQEELGRQCSVSKNTISNIELGISDPSVTLAFAISESLGVPIERVFYIEPAFG